MMLSFFITLQSPPQLPVLPFRRAAFTSGAGDDHLKLSYSSFTHKCSSLHLKRGLFCQSSLVQQGPVQPDDQQEELVHEIEIEFESLALHEALRMVDLMERLGIQRFFKCQIDRILNSVYMQWDEGFGFKDGELTVLAFRLLRVHGYDVSTDVLRSLKEKSGGFFTSLSVEKPGNIYEMMDLYKCSQISFPFESKLMDELCVISRAQLSKILLLEDSTQHNHSLIDEVRFTLQYPQNCCLPRMESRSIIRRLGRCPINGFTMKCLELAKHDLTILQRLHRQEMDEQQEWWNEQGFEDFEFTRKKTQKVYYYLAATMFESMFWLCRVTFTKLISFIIVLDDIFALSSSDFQSICHFNEAIQRWDLSSLKNESHYHVIGQSMIKNLTEIATMASTAQGRELFQIIKTLWQEFVALYTKEEEWKHSGVVPAMNECLQVGHITYGGGAVLKTLINFLGEPVTDELLQKLERIIYLISLTTRLSNDISTFEREEKNGELYTSIVCFMRGNPGSTTEEAIISINGMISKMWKETEWEVFQCRQAGLPEVFIRLLLSWAQATFVTYQRGDGFSDDSDTGLENIIRDYLHGTF